MTGDLAEKVRDLLDHNAVMLVTGWEDRAAVVHGETGMHLVKAYASGVTCSCMAGSTGVLCSHAAAAMIVWAEQAEARAKLSTDPRRMVKA